MLSKTTHVRVEPRAASTLILSNLFQPSRDRSKKNDNIGCEREPKLLLLQELGEQEFLCKDCVTSTTLLSIVNLLPSRSTGPIWMLASSSLPSGSITMNPDISSHEYHTNNPKSRSHARKLEPWIRLERPYGVAGGTRPSWRVGVPLNCGLLPPNGIQRHAQERRSIKSGDRRMTQYRHQWLHWGYTSQVAVLNQPLCCESSPRRYFLTRRLDIST